MEDELQKAIEHIESLIQQSCDIENGRYDSMAISTYASAMLFLEKHGRFKIQRQSGRRVIGKFV